MIVAWHMVTDIREDPNAVGFMTWKTSFEEVKRTGVILPARMRGVKFIPQHFTKREWRKLLKSYYSLGAFFKNSYMIQVDAIAGDNSYVFLGLSPFRVENAFLPELFDRTNELGACTYGFGFDAESLVENGAIVRRRDYAQYYNEIVRYIASDVIAKKIAETVDASTERERFDRLIKKARSIFDEGITNIENCLHYIGRLGKMKELRKALLEFKAKNDMQGSKALEFVRNAYQKCIDSLYKGKYPPECIRKSDFQLIEILWPGPLHIKNAKYVIEGGVTKRL